MSPREEKGAEEFARVFNQGKQIINVTAESRLDAEEFARVFNQEANRFIKTLDKVRNIYGADNYTAEVVDDTISVYEGEKDLVDIRRKIKAGLRFK